MSSGEDGIDLRCTPCGPITGNCCDQEQNRGYGYECERVRGGDAEQQVRQQPREAKSRRRSQYDAQDA